MCRLVFLVCLTCVAFAVERFDVPQIKALNAEQGVRLEKLAVEVKVLGLFAETTQTMVFYNPNHRVLEGKLTVPMPDGGSVCAYALDVHGKMVDGVIVAKQKARQILEAEERRGIDPGIVEKVVGNLYRTRIYPIPARGRRTIKLTYTSPLLIKGQDAAYHLPLSSDQQLERISVKVQIMQAPVTPVISGLGNLSLTKWQNGWRAETVLTKATVSDDLTISLPKIPNNMQYIETTENGECFIAMLSKKENLGKKVLNPNRFALAWDASGSSEKHHAKSIEALQSILKENISCIVDLVVLRDKAETPVSFTDSEKLIAFLKTIPYDGGTSINSLNFTKSALPHSGDICWLVFSDGVDTMGASTMPLLDTVPVFSISASAVVNRSLLRYLAKNTNGNYIDLLTASSEDCKKIFTTKIEPSYNFDNQIGEAHISSRAHHSIMIAKLLGTKAVVSVGNKKHAFERNSASSGFTLARIWAKQEAEKLEVNKTINATKLLELGKQYNIVTAGTSLLVLESLTQYLRYNIEPPKTSLPTIHRQWMANRNKTINDKERNEKQKLNTVFAWWQQRVRWWETDFKPRKNLVKKLKELKLSIVADEIVEGAVVTDLDLPAEEPKAREDAEAGGVAAFMAIGAGGGSKGRLSNIRRVDKMKKRESVSAPASIKIKGWNPNTPYLQIIKANSANAYQTYLSQKESYISSPSFFLDCADYLIKNNQKELGLRVLSNLSEMGIDDAALKRVHAWRLQQAGAVDRAVVLLESVFADRPDEPQSHRDLALALTERGSINDIRRAKSLLWNIVVGKWDRFPQIEVIALMELNKLIAKDNIVPEYVDSRFVKNLGVDMRISLSWDADATDVDLHVFESNGEHASYSHNRTSMGGLVSRDFTRGYGPEEYLVKKALPGNYQIKVHYFGSRQQTLVGPATVTATVYTNYGRANEQKQVLTLRLDKRNDMVLVGSVTIGENDGTIKKNIKNINFQSIKRITKGMTITEVMSILGMPSELKTNKTINTLIYNTPTDTYHITVNGTVTASRQILDGAEKNLLR